ncbi:MAG TPA: hypothetical protein VLC73_01680 [Burkholderiales bacterium]|nr:hypothetical protein [Burkholderiales bacterium]
MTPDYYDPRKAGELFLEDPARIAKAAPALPPPDEDRVKIAAFGPSEHRRH